MNKEGNAQANEQDGAETSGEQELTAQELAEATEKYLVGDQAEAAAEGGLSYSESVAEAREKFFERQGDFLDDLSDVEDFDELRATVKAHAMRVEGQIDNPGVKKSVAGKVVIGIGTSLTSSLENTLTAIDQVEAGEPISGMGGLIVGEALWSKVEELAKQQENKEEVVE